MGNILVKAASIIALAALVAFGGNDVRAADDVPSLALSGGVFNVRRSHDIVAEGRLEYRHGRGWWILKPFGGIMATTDKSIYGYVGVYADFLLTEHLYIQPSFAPGLYHRGDGYDLGGALEFRSQIEFGWRFDDGARVGLAASHMSNGHIYDRNNGAESLMLTVSLPLDW